MRTSTHNKQHGLTLIELCFFMVASAILMLGLSGILANQQKSLVQVRDRAFGDITTDTYVTQRIFERYGRSATLRKCLIGSDGSSLEIYGYSSPTVLVPDQYIYYHLADSQLVMERGQLASGTFSYASNNSPLTTILAHHVTNAVFSESGPVLHMFLQLDDGRRKSVLSASAYRQND